MLMALALLSATAPLATDMYLPGLPTVEDDLVTSASTVQLTLTTFMAGLGIGQIIIGPLSDSWGRRKLLLGGTVTFVITGMLCALAPSIEVLIAARLLQGLSGGAAIVLARAAIADRAKGDEAAKLFSIMMIIGGVAPVLAPLLGGALLGPIGWRGIFWVLAGAGVLMVLGITMVIPETLPPERRHSGGLIALARNMRSVAGNRRFIGYTMTFMFGFGALFSYISASPFVAQDALGLSPGQFSLVFGVNSIGIVGGNIVNTRLIGRFHARQLLTFGVLTLLTTGLALVLAVTVGGTERWVVLPLMFLMTTTLGFIMGNATALGQAQVPHAAGTGSAVMGAGQFGLAAVVSPLVGSSATGMATSILICAAVATIALLVLARPTATTDTPTAATTAARTA
ncbi:multidrug effflux MFS transporter [Nocardia vermiculata]|uniref:Multidrug effflux MFS transporter n=1 Tax=Nocardia vermiculata TaxID=257274 RepID=A0A846Y3V1_9NOCA|nr:multidrug effflux MFS transporter [Nocardia vermiculata]NKY51948.1 multidrug effflux MFS transporter [Nocardia vermiculata]